MRPAARRIGSRRNDLRQGRELQERAILPALHCEGRARSRARALRVTRDGLRPPLGVILPGSGWRQVGYDRLL